MATLKTVPTQKKYGLQPKRCASTKKALPSSSISFFSSSLEEDDEEEEVDNEKEKSSGGRRTNSGKRNDLILKRANYEILQRSTTTLPLTSSLTDEEKKIYDYDGSYDDFKEKENEKLKKSMNLLGADEAPKARYISKIQATAIVREKEKDRIYEKILLKERQQEDAEFGDKPKFITSEYKRKLMEDQKWEMEDKIADEIEQRTSVSSRGMHGFYANLLTKNIAMGGDVAESAVSAYTAGSRRQQLRLGDEMPGGEASSSSSPAAAPLPAEAELPQKRPQHEQADGGDEKRMKVIESNVVMAPAINDPPPCGASLPPPPIIPTLPEPTVSKDEMILSAKERYLQRKRQQLSSE